MRREVVVVLAGLALALSASGCGGERSHMMTPPSESEVAARMDAEAALARVRNALSEVPEVTALRERIEAAGGRFVVMLEGDADPAVDHPAVWQVYVGESRPEHRVRLWAFNVDAVSGALTITDPLTLEDVPFERWREELAASPP